MLLQCSRKEFHLIGKALVRQQPEIAAAILSQLSYFPPIDSELNNITDYFQKYSRIINIHPETITSTPYDTAIVGHKKVFVATIVGIYAPAAFRQSTADVMLKRGLVKAIGKELLQTHQYISLLIKEVIMHYKRYDDFRLKVDDAISVLTGGPNE